MQPRLRISFKEVAIFDDIQFALISLIADWRALKKVNPSSAG
jgi:hypothetical protein